MSSKEARKALYASSFNESTSKSHPHLQLQYKQYHLWHCHELELSVKGPGSQSFEKVLVRAAT